MIEVNVDAKFIEDIPQLNGGGGQEFSSNQNGPSFKFPEEVPFSFGPVYGMVNPAELIGVSVDVINKTKEFVSNVCQLQTRI